MLYDVRADLSREEIGILAVNGLKPNMTVWVSGIRKTAHGSYGTVQTVYESRPGYFSPTGKVTNNLPLRYLTPADMV